MSLSTDPVTCDNVMLLSLDEVRVRLFGLIERHDKSLILDQPLYVRLLGEYAGLYQYMSEIYVYLIARVRAYTEARNTLQKIAAQDRRDCLEHVLKVVKMNYDALSRKVTVMQAEGN